MDEPLIQAGRDLLINPLYVASLSYDRRHYMNGPGDTVLVIRMADGHEHRIRHEAHYLGGADVYAIEKAIRAALEGRRDE